MGCDIHVFLEADIDGKWAFIKDLSYRVYGNQDYCGARNYARFAKLAGVRGDGPEAKGVPADVSPGTKWHIDRYGMDGHSHSYDNAVRFLGICEATSHQTDETPRDFRSQLEFWCEIYHEEEPLKAAVMYRFVYFFDN